MMNYTNGYTPNTWQPNYANLQQYTQPLPTLTTTYVSDIAEAIATKPDVTGKPLFFYNKATEEIYLKQYDNTGAAPVKTYKLVVETAQPETNPYLESFKSLDHKLDDIKKLLTPEVIEETEKRSKR